MSDWLKQAWPEEYDTFDEGRATDKSAGREERPSHGAELTDKGNADLLRDKLIGGTRWCADLGTWIDYTGRRWEKQPDAGVVREAAASLELDRGDSSRKAEDIEKARARHYKYSRSDRGVSAMVSLLRDQAVMRVNSADLDGYTYELNTPDGIVNLPTGMLGPSMPEHFHTKMTAVGYNPAMATPQWDTFLQTTFGGDLGLIDFMRRLCGLASIGEVLEHTLPFFFGQGSNGKSVLCEVLLGVFGSEYAITAPANFLIAGRDKHETEIARLRGARVVVCSEVNKGAQFDEQKTKMLTGGDQLSGRGMRENFSDFTPSHTLILTGNHKPTMTGGGISFWRRLSLVPFLHQVAPEDRKEGLAAKLVAEEGPGILAWIVSGAVDYLRSRNTDEHDKLRVPASVRQASEAYREDTQGSVERFLSDCCTVGRDQAPQRASAVYASYRAWAFAMGEQPVSDAQFGLDGSSYGLDKATRNSSGARYFVTVHTDRLPANESVA
jgi:P4 family phage/plasmid primase-like protien